MSTVSPWVKIATPKADSLKDVMSEQLADELQEEEIKTLQDDEDNQIIASMKTMKYLKNMKINETVTAKVNRIKK